MSPIPMSSETCSNRARRFVLTIFLFLTVFVRAASANEADAIGISQNIRMRHMPFGTILDPVFASPESDQIVGYTHCGDSAIWTGHFLAAEAFRYAVTRSAEALDNVKTALSGTSSLLNVTGTNLLARCLMPVNWPHAQSIIQEEASHGIFENKQDG